MTTRATFCLRVNVNSVAEVEFVLVNVMLECENLGQKCEQ
jgi:hypothetical protein